MGEVFVVFGDEGDGLFAGEFEVGGEGGEDVFEEVLGLGLWVLGFGFCGGLALESDDVADSGVVQYF